MPPSVSSSFPVIEEKPLAGCGCRKFQIDPLGDHLARVPPTRVPKRRTTGRLINLLTFSSQHTKSKHKRSLKAGVIIVGTSN
jgi:hypothetical protein